MCSILYVYRVRPWRTSGLPWTNNKVICGDFSIKTRDERGIYYKLIPKFCNRKKRTYFYPLRVILNFLDLLFVSNKTVLNYDKKGIKHQFLIAALSPWLKIVPKWYLLKEICNKTFLLSVALKLQNIAGVLKSMKW